MNSLVEKYAQKLDALTRRERLMAFTAGVVLILFIAYTLAIGPALERAKQMAVRIADQKNQIAAIAAQKVELQRSSRTLTRMCASVSRRGAGRSPRSTPSSPGCSAR